MHSSGTLNGSFETCRRKLIIHSEERGIFDIDQVNSDLRSGADTKIDLLAGFRRFYRYIYADQQGQNKEVRRSETVHFRLAGDRRKRLE